MYQEIPGIFLSDTAILLLFFPIVEIGKNSVEIRQFSLKSKHNGN